MYKPSSGYQIRCSQNRSQAIRRIATSMFFLIWDLLLSLGVHRWQVGVSHRRCATSSHRSGSASGSSTTRTSGQVLDRRHFVRDEVRFSASANAPRRGIVLLSVLFVSQRIIRRQFLHHENWWSSSRYHAQG